MIFKSKHTSFKWNDDQMLENECISMSDRQPTRWQHNRIYPHPINPCMYTYDSICHLQISIKITI